MGYFTKGSQTRWLHQVKGGSKGIASSCPQSKRFFSVTFSLLASILSASLPLYLLIEILSFSLAPFPMALPLSCHNMELDTGMQFAYLCGKGEGNPGASSLCISVHSHHYLPHTLQSTMGAFLSQLYRAEHRNLQDG